MVSDGVVLIHTSNGQLQALNEADGAVKWTVNLDMPSLSLRGESAPASAFGAAIVGGDNGRVSAVLMQQGQMIWQQRISQATGPTEIDRLSDVDTTPVIVNGVVYATAYNGNLTALDLRSGEVMWKRELGSVNDFIVDGNRIYLVDQNDRVLALTTDGGVTLWTQSDLLHRLLTSPALYNGNLVVGDSEGYLHWINIDDGRFVAQQKVDSSGFLTEPVSADGKLLIGRKTVRCIPLRVNRPAARFEKRLWCRGRFPVFNNGVKIRPLSDDFLNEALNMVPVVALVGRPNVGKSTLFNRLTRTRDALVADFPGLTRDRKYGRAEIEGREFICVDTGGIDGTEDGVETRMAAQSLLAIEEADVVLFMVDARAGLMPADEAIAKHLRSRQKPTFWLPTKLTDSIRIRRWLIFIRWG